MKKVLSFIFVLMITLVLTACNDKTYGEKKDNTKFKDYLSDTLNEIDADKVDEKFGTISAPSEYLEKIKFTNTEFTLDEYEEGSKTPEYSESVYLWKDEEVFYFYAGLYDFYSLDTSFMDDLYEEMGIEDMKFSEILEDEFEVDLDEILDCIEFSIDDFEETDEKNVYLLKVEAIARVLEDLSGTDADEIEDAIDEMDKFECYVTYGNGKIRTVTVKIKQKIKQEEEELVVKETLSISFLYDQETGLCGLRFDEEVKLSYEGEEMVSSTGYYTISKAGMELEATVSGYALEELGFDKISASLKLDATSLTASATVYDGKDKIQLVKADVTLEENYVKSGTIEITKPKNGDKIVMTIVTGKKVSLPDVDVKHAEDLMDMIGGSKVEQPEYWY